MALSYSDTGMGSCRVLLHSRLTTDDNSTLYSQQVHRKDKAPRFKYYAIYTCTQTVPGTQLIWTVFGHHLKLSK